MGRIGRSGRLAASPPPDTDCRFWSPSSRPSIASLLAVTDAPSVFYWWDAGKARCLPCSHCEGPQVTLRACTLISDTKCGLKEERKNSTEEEVALDKEKEEEEDNSEEDGVLVYEAKGQVEKGPPAFGKEKRQWEEPPGVSRSSTRDVHRERMGEELQKAGIDFGAAEKSSEKLEKKTRSSTAGGAFADAKYSAPAFGNPKFYVDPDEDQDGGDGKVGGGREKHLANVVKELLKEGLPGKVNKSDPSEQKHDQDDSDQSDPEETSLPSEEEGGQHKMVQKNAFREIVALMGEEEEEGVGGKNEKVEDDDGGEKEEDEAEVPRNLEAEMVQHKLLISVSSLTFFLVLTCLAVLLSRGSSDGGSPRYSTLHTTYRPLPPPDQGCAHSNRAYEYDEDEDEDEDGSEDGDDVFSNLQESTAHREILLPLVSTEERRRKREEEKMWRTKEALQKEEQRRWKKAEDERRWKKDEGDIGKWKKEDESRWRTEKEKEEDEEEEAERSGGNLDYVAGCGVLGVRRRSTFRSVSESPK